MANYQPHRNQPEHNPSHQGPGFGKGKPPSKPTQESKRNKSMEELEQEVRRICFKQHYEEILKFEQTQHLDGLLQETVSFVKELGSWLNANQLRKVFTEVKNAVTPQALKLKRPHLAYMAARSDNIKARQSIA